MRPFLSRSRRFCIHGQAMDLVNGVDWLDAALQRWLDYFEVDQWPEEFNPLRGEIRPFDHGEILQHISPYTSSVPRPEQGLEIFEDGQRFWVVDDRWGMMQIDLQRGTWTSWVLPEPTLDPIQCAEMAIIWPLAQLLPERGLHLLPSVTVTRGKVTVMILSPFGLEVELQSLVMEGCRIVGQRWTAVREEEGRIAALHVPGAVRRRQAPGRPGSPRPQNSWTDLLYEHPLSRSHHAFLDAVLVADGGIRSEAQVRPMQTSESINALRRSWPLMELRPQGGYARLPLRLAQRCHVCELQLSRQPWDLVELIESLRPWPDATMLNSISVKVFGAEPRPVVVP